MGCTGVEELDLVETKGSAGDGVRGSVVGAEGEKNADAPARRGEKGLLGCSCRSASSCVSASLRLCVELSHLQQARKAREKQFIFHKIAFYQYQSLYINFSSLFLGPKFFSAVLYNRLMRS